MKPHAQILEGLKSLGTFNKFEPWIVDGLANILFDNEEILHAFHADIAYYTNAKQEKSENGYFAVCTNERIIFIKMTAFSGVKSDIVLIKNIHSFEVKSSQIILKTGEQSIKVTISNYELTRTFGLILGYITAGRKITLTEIKLENEQHKAHLEQVKLEQKEQFERQINQVI